MIWNMPYNEAVAKADHLLAVGEDTIHIEAENAPWEKADGVEEGCGYRLNGPTGCYIVAHESGLTFKWSVDFEGRDANGRGVSLFDRDRLRDVAMRLPAPVRAEFADFLRDKVLPGLQKNTREIRDALNRQMDSEDCVRGLIAFAAQ